MIEQVKIDLVKSNPNNPRIIKDDKFAKLVESIKTFPEMLKLRPIVVNDEMIVLGGNMRLKACKEAGLKEVPIIKASNLTEEQQREFIIKDNVGFGEWDWDALANEWDSEDLEAWGLDLLLKEIQKSELYSAKIESPIYNPKGEVYEIKDLTSEYKYNELLNKIEESKIDEEVKMFLKKAATRFIEFDFKKIAEYYSSAKEEEKEIFELLALVIIDFNKAIENGFIELTERLFSQYDLENE